MKKLLFIILIFFLNDNSGHALEDTSVCLVSDALEFYYTPLDTKPVSLISDALEFYYTPLDTKPVSLISDVLEFYYIPFNLHSIALMQDNLEYYFIKEDELIKKNKRIDFINIRKQIHRRRLR